MRRRIRKARFPLSQ